MKNKFTLVINAGRSGSTYLFNILKKNFAEAAYIAHEDIPITISLPRKYNRIYDRTSINKVLQDRNLMQYIDLWQDRLSSHPVVETGWTAYHLAPVLRHIFQERFQYIILHRHPVEFAASRAVMGNYHPETFYNDPHEVSPFDSKSICPTKQSQWNSMNHFEKCLFWWYVVYSEAYEFRDQYPNVSYIEIGSKLLFNNREKIASIVDFLGIKTSKQIDARVNKNALPRHLHETFPLENEWLDYKKHGDIIEFAEQLGYCFNEQHLATTISKYKLPQGILPKLRNYTGYWKTRRKLKYILTKSTEKIGLSGSNT